MQSTIKERRRRTKYVRNEVVCVCVWRTDVNLTGVFIRGEEKKKMSSYFLQSVKSEPLNFSAVSWSGAGVGFSCRSSRRTVN